MRSDENTAAGIDLGRVVNALPALVWTTQGDGRSDFVNRYWCEYTGLSADALVDHGWHRAIHPEDLRSFLDRWSVIRQSGVVEEIDARLRRCDGEYRWFVFRASFMEDPGGRGRWCWLGLYADESTATDGRMRRLFDMLPWQAGFLNGAGSLEFTNLRSMKDFNMTHLELERWTSSGIIHVADHERNDEALAALLTTGKMLDQQLRMLYPDGVYRWTRARCVPVRDAQGNVVRYVTFQIDVDDLKRAEDLLAAEVKVLERVARGEPLSRVLDALSRQIEELCNDCFCNILVIAPDNGQFEVGAGAGLTDTFNDIFNRRSIDRGGHDPYSMALIEKVPIVVRDWVNDSRWEGTVWPAMMKSHGYASCWLMPIISGSGEASGVIAIYRREPVNPRAQEQDLIDRFAKIAGIAIERARADTALRAGEAALRASEAEQRRVNMQLMDAHRLSRTGSFTWDVPRDDHIWTEEVFRLFEFDPETKVNTRRMFESIHPEDRPTVEGLLGRAVASTEFELEFRVLTHSGSVKHARMIGRRIGEVTDRTVFMGAMQDVTTSKVAEEALSQARLELTHVARMATLSAMTASITHEVAQPISGILTNSNTCARALAADPPNVARAAETIRRTIRDANRASEVVRRLRAMFAKKAPTMEMVDLNEAAQEVIAMSSAELRRSRSVLQTEFAQPLPAISGDRVQLQQVILNLLLNAADAMAGIEDRPRTLRVHTQIDGNGVQLLVQDCGVGLDPHGTEKLFEPFHTTKAHGLGIGLAISRTIIESHRGKLWATANDGPGATFGFSIPYAPGTAAITSSEILPLRGGSHSPGGPS
jgi:PAS domain S-box-containing protein